MAESINVRCGQAISVDVLGLFILFSFYRSLHRQKNQQNLDRMFVFNFNFSGQNFVVFRTESGEVHIFDAYCPHLGANLGVGGIVKDDCIECPFHQWSFRASDGECTNIPYSTSGTGE